MLEEVPFCSTVPTTVATATTGEEREAAETNWDLFKTKDTCSILKTNSVFLVAIKSLGDDDFQSEQLPLSELVARCV